MSQGLPAGGWQVKPSVSDKKSRLRLYEVLQKAKQEHRGWRCPGTLSKPRSFAYQTLDLKIGEFARIWKGTWKANRNH